VILPGSSLYLANKAAAFRARTTGPRGGQGLYIQGNYDGSLSARGETIQLVDPRDPANPADDRVVATTTTPVQPTPAQRQLRLTELMFHPAPGGSFNEEEYEFIELANLGDTALDLTGATFTNGITFTFSPNGPILTLAPGARLLLLKNATAFAERHGAGHPVAGTYDGSLSNSGERLRLVDAVGEEVLDFTYDDSWQPGTDGGGYSLVLRDPTSPPDAWSLADAWRSSLAPGGSPGTADATPSFRFAPGDLAVTLEGSVATLHFLGAPEQSYRLDTSTDFTEWREVGPIQTDAAGRARIEVRDAASPQYYRVRAPLP
jgi:hypothetical protein